MTQINNSFGSGEMSLSLNEAHFSQFIQYLKDQAVKLPIQIAATRIGLQETNPPVWVMGKGLQINADGERVADKEIKIFWHLDSLMESLGNIHINEVLPSITLRLGTSALIKEVSYCFQQYNYFMMKFFLIG